MFGETWRMDCHFCQHDHCGCFDHDLLIYGGQTHYCPCSAICKKPPSAWPGEHFADLPIHNDDEIGRLTGAFNQMMHAQQAAISETNRVMSALSQGDFSQRIEGHIQGELGVLATRRE